MKIIEYKKIKPTEFNNDKMKGVAARVVIGKNDGAENFYMRVFEVSAGGHSPVHSHDWEHEIFIHSGSGEVFHNGNKYPVKAGDALFIPANEEHQLINTSGDLLVFVCLIPSKAPEL